MLLLVVCTYVLGALFLGVRQFILNPVDDDKRGAAERIRWMLGVDGGEEQPAQGGGGRLGQAKKGKKGRRRL